MGITYYPNAYFSEKYAHKISGKSTFPKLVDKQYMFWDQTCYGLIYFDLVNGDTCPRTYIPTIANFSPSIFHRFG